MPLTVCRIQMCTHSYMIRTEPVSFHYWRGECQVEEVSVATEKSLRPRTSWIALVDIPRLTFVFPAPLIGNRRASATRQGGQRAAGRREMPAGDRGRTVVTVSGVRRSNRAPLARPSYRIRRVSNNEGRKEECRAPTPWAAVIVDAPSCALACLLSSDAGILLPSQGGGQRATTAITFSAPPLHVQQLWP